MKQLIFLLAVAVMMAGCKSYEHYQSYTDTIELNGVKLFYAVEGQGKPVILIHGNGGSHNDLETTHRQLAQAGYTVYAMDSRGQGANKPLDEYHYKDMARDVLAFIRTKGLAKPAVYGWSDGGIVALELESMYPGTCSLIVTSGANITATNALQPDFYNSKYPPGTNPDKLHPLQRLMFLEPNMTADDMARITIPVLVCAGEKDLITLEHTQLIGRSLPQGEVKIIPGGTHGNYIVRNPMMGNILIDYFKSHNY